MSDVIEEIKRIVTSLTSSNESVHLTNIKYTNTSIKIYINFQYTKYKIL